AAKKELYANDLDDPEHIVAVYRSANRSKGSKGPEEWMPPDEPDWCDYVDDWKTIKERWGLSMNDDEAEKVAEVMEGCGQ
ncbi:MAG: hypothetical protein JW751_12415, partial [Polyangiaceae bacterium]|nr:hypothetical protein [Polyangiaceae bacterium]